MANIEEYKTLRTEIITCQQLEISMIWSIILASGAILAATITKDNPNPYVFLSPLVLIIPGMLSQAVLCGGIMRIGSYISVFHESDKSDLRWETRNWRMVANNKPTGYANPYLRFISTSMFPGLSAISILLAWQTHKIPWHILTAIIISAIVGFSYATYKLISVRTQHNNYIQRWKSMKEEEDAKMTARIATIATHELSEPQQ